MGGKDAPDPPDYRGAAEEQSEASAEIALNQTYANRPTQVTPWGTLSYSTSPGIDPGTGQRVSNWTQTLELDPQAQEALDAQQNIQAGRSGLAQSLLDRASEEFSPEVDYGDYTDFADVPQFSSVDAPELQSSLDFSNAYEVGDPNRYRAQAEDAVYGKFTSRLDPMFEDRADQMETRLRSQGLQPGDEAYDRAMRNLNFARNDAYANASREAVLTGRGEAESMFGMDASRRGIDTGEAVTQGNFFNQAAGTGFGQEMASEQANFRSGLQSGQFQNTQRQAEISEEMQRRGYSLNEINAILTGQQVQQPNMPGFMGASAGETPQYLAAANMQGQADLNAFSAEQAALQGMMSGVGSIAGGAGSLGWFGGG